MAHPNLNQLDDFLQALPDEIITVVGNHMTLGDRLTGRLVSKQWKQLLRACDTHLQIGPYYFALEPPAQEQTPKVKAGHTLRPRGQHIVPTAASNRQPPACLQPPLDTQDLPTVFPCINKVSVRLIWRHGGVRGEGISAQPARVTALFDALTAITSSRGLPQGHPQLCSDTIQEPPPPPPPPSADATDTSTSSQQQQQEGGSGQGRQAVYGTGSNRPAGQAGADGVETAGLDVTIQLDIDVPRSRYKDAYGAAQRLAQVAALSLARLGPGVKSCRIQWFDARLAHMSHLGGHISHLSGLRRLELPMTPGSLLPALSALTALTCLHISSVGDEMHMQDLGVPRHTEICVLSHLTRLVELRLDGWVCEVALLRSLLELSQLRSLKLGDDLTSASQELPLAVLSCLSALTLPISLSISHLDLEAPPAPQAPGTPSSPLPAHITGRSHRHVPQCILPRLTKLSGPPPMARVHDGAPACAASAATDPPGTPGSPAPHQQGAARRRSLTPSIILPNLQELVVELSLFTVSHMVGGELDVGRLQRLTHLRLHVTALSPEDLMMLQQMMKVIADGDLPRLQELHIQMARPQVSPGTVLSTALVANAFRDAAAAGKLPALKSLFITRLWDGLVPEGWDYTTKGPTGGAPGQRMSPSGLYPKQHLSFLHGLPSLSSLHLQIDRVRLDVLPPTLTSLVLEGLVLIDAPGGGTAVAAGAQCPRLKKLIVVLAKHPRTHTPSARQPTPSVNEAAAAGTSTPAAAPAHPLTSPLNGTTAMATPATTPASLPPARPQQERGQYCVLQALTPVLPTCLTYLTFTATPAPATTRLDQLTPTDYGIPVITQHLPDLVSLQLFVMPKYQWLVDCRQLSGLSSLTRLRELNLESPVTGATRLVCLTALSTLTQLTRLSTGLLDDDAYSGQVMLSGCTPAERRSAFLWLSRLVAARFGRLPTPPVASWANQRSRSSASPAPNLAGLPAGGDEDSDGASSEAASEEVEEDGPGALQGSDVEVHSEDLLYESGEGEGEELSSEMLYEDE